jgi:hypothetical protein
VNKKVAPPATLTRLSWIASMDNAAPAGRSCAAAYTSTALRAGSAAMSNAALTPPPAKSAAAAINHLFINAPRQRPYGGGQAIPTVLVNERPSFKWLPACKPILDKASGPNIVLTNGRCNHPADR